MPAIKIGDIVEVFEAHGIVHDIVNDEYWIKLFTGGCPFVMTKKNYGKSWKIA